MRRSLGKINWWAVVCLESTILSGDGRLSFYIRIKRCADSSVASEAFPIPFSNLFSVASVGFASAVTLCRLRCTSRLDLNNFDSFQFKGISEF